MTSNVSKTVSNIFQDFQFGYDKVSFNPGVPPLANELNILQEYQELLTQKSTAAYPSGWLSYRPIYTSNDLSNSFYTQDPDGAKPEVALVNGWPIYVTNTNTDIQHVNKINLTDFELKSGSRVDGIFLEVWRSLVTPGDTNIYAKPQNVSQIGSIYSIFMYDDSLGWAIGDNGTILKTVNGGDIWVTKNPPVSTQFNRISFYDQNLGYAVGDGGYIIKTINGGETWFLLSTPVNDNLNDLSVIDQNTIVVIGDNGTVLKSIDGSTFELIESTSGVTTNFNGIYFFDNRVGWIVGDTGTLLISIDGGQTWRSQVVLDIKSSNIIKTDLTSVSFFNLNDGLVIGKNGTILKTPDGGYHFVDMSDRIWNGSVYSTLNKIYPTSSIDLNRIFIKEEFINKFTIGVLGSSSGFFSSIIYSISPSDHPNSLVLQFRGTLDGVNYNYVLDLDDYASAEDLATAVNNIYSPYSPDDVSLPPNQRKTIRVFQMTVSYASALQPSDFRPSNGIISNNGTTDISFSVEDKAWIVGNDGLVLKTSNSGSKWEVITNPLGFDLYDIYFTSDNYGWISGSDGSILLYDPLDIPTNFEVQDTDLPLKTKGRIYPEGNILSQADTFLEDDIIDPQVGVETSDRVQIQYSVRVATGIDPFTYPEAGMGAEYVYSLGPNDDTTDAGSYTFSNMGQENGDYGLWKAHCRNTYDGWVWAIPMFMVTRRNSSPFDPNTNINGSTIYSLNAVRPDGLTYEEIDASEVIDLRKKVNIQSYTALMEKNFDKLLGNRLGTKLSTRDESGTQYGTSILLADTYIGISDLNNLISGLVTSEAVIAEDIKELDPNGITPLATSDFTLGPTLDSIYLTDPSYHKVVSKINGAETSKTIPGTFSGLGTNTIIFNIGSYSPDPGETYVIHANRIDYTKDGLSRVPNEPLGIKYVPDVEDNSVFYRGINENTENLSIEYLEERVPGYKDYTDFYSAIEIGTNQDDIYLYQSTNNYVESSLDYPRSLIKFKGQQFKGSLIEYHYFMQATDYINVLQIPKNVNNYTVFNVKSITDAKTGAQYLISTDYVNNNTVWSESPLSGGGYDNSSITINIDKAFTIPKNAVIEVILEVVPSLSTTATILGFTQANIGPNIQAYRAPNVTDFNVGSKGIIGLYKSVLYNTPILSGAKYIEVDLTNPTPNNDGDITNGIILGLSSYGTKEVTYQSYVWYKSNSDLYFHTIPVQNTINLGTSTVFIYFDNRVSISDGTIYVPMLVKQTQFSGASATSEAYVFYKYRPYQAIDNLPSELTVEVLTSSDFLYVSNLGTGGSNKIKKDPYENPIDHIPVNDTTFVTDNIFTNIVDLEFPNFSIDTGLIKLPAYLSRKLGEDITLSSPNNIGDRLGRAYYTACDDTFKYQTERLVSPVPRKVFFPVLGRVRSDLISPVVRGEIVLIIFSKMFTARTENMSGMFEDDDTEYTPGYFETDNTAIAVYRLVNYPTVRI